MLEDVADISLFRALRPDRPIVAMLEEPVSQMHVNVSEGRKLSVKDVICFEVINRSGHLAKRYSRPVSPRRRSSRFSRASKLRSNRIELFENTRLTGLPMVSPKKSHCFTPEWIFTVLMLQTCVHLTFVENSAEVDVLPRAVNGRLGYVMGGYICLKHRSRDGITDGHREPSAAERAAHSKKSLCSRQVVKEKTHHERGIFHTGRVKRDFVCVTFSEIK